MKVSAYGDITITIVNEPFSIHLSNEAQQFPTDENRKVSENLSYYTDVSVIKGEVSNPNFTIGEVKSANGITVSKNANRITFSVKAGVILPADSGSFDIPVTLDGETLIKTFSWSCQKSGAAAKSVKITASSTIFKSSDGGETYSPDTITLSPSLQGGISFSKWQYSVTGGSSWTDIKTGTHGFTISSTSLIVSKNCDLFTSETTSITLRCLSSNEKYYDTITIQKMRDGKDADTSGIDGRNRISFGSGEYQKGFFKNFSKTEQGYGEHTLTSKKQYSNVNLTDGFLLGCRDYKVGEKVTFSYDIMYTEWNFPTGSDRSEFWIGQRYTNSTDSSAIGTWRAVTMHNLPVVGEGGCKLGAWYHVEKTMTVPEQADESVGTTASIQFYNSSAEKEAKITFRMKNVKLEYGEKATDWSPAPEDNISSIKTLETIARKNTLDIETKVGKADFFKVINPDTGEDEKQTISEFMSTSTQNMYGFKREVKQQYDSLELGGVNLFVQNTTIQGKYLSSENVEIKDSAWGYSDYIDLSGMDYYIASGFTNLGAAPATCFYNSDKVFLSGVKSEIQDSQESKRKMLQIPDSAAFMRFSFLLADIETLKIEKGTKSTSYSPSPEDVAHNIKTVEEQTATKFSWLVKSGTSESNFELTDRIISLISKNINLNGIVTFMNTAKGEVYKNLYASTGYADFESIKSTDEAICYAKFDSNSVAIDSSTYWQGSNSLKISGTAKDRVRVYLGNKENNYGCIKVEQGKTYQITAYVKSDSEQNVSFGIDWITHGTKIDAATGTCYIESYLFNPQKPSFPKGCTTITPNTSWQRAITTFTVTDKTNSYYYISIVPTIYNQLSKNANFWVDGIMVEEVESLNSEPNEFTNSAKATIIDGNSILTDSITADKLTANSITAEKIMADALKSKNYVVGESGSFLNLADGSFDSKYLKWDNAGKVIANDITVVGGSINVNDKFIVNNDGIATLQGATVVGNITAESGKIGKFNLDNLALVTGDTDVTCAGLGGSSQAFWAGSLTMDDAPFRVGYDGSFYSSKGKIAGWEITSDSFYKDTDDYTVYVCPGTNNNKDFLTVHDKNKSSGDEWPFYVHADGWMHCVYGDIGGWNIGKNSINSSYSNTETTEYYVSDSFYSLSILSDSSKIISEFNEKKYSDSSKQKILSSESDSLTVSGDSIQGTSRYILYGEETDKSGYSFLLSAYNGLEILDEVSEEGISYTGNHILFTRYNETVAEITEDKINSCHAGEVCHYYGNGYVDCGTNNNKYYDLSAFTTGGGKTFGSFHTKMSNEKIKINRTGVYCFQVRFSVNSGVKGSADKRVEFVPFVNNTRLPRYAASFSSRGNFSITNFQTYILSLNKGDVVAFDISPIEKVSVRVQIADIFVHVLDYVNKYADEYN